jgi:hypothetical protein
MESLKKIITSTSVLAIVWLLMSCEQKIMVESVVHADGAIDRTIIFTEVDSSKVAYNMFGINEKNGWKTTLERIMKKKDTLGNTKSEQKYTITFHKKFASADEANKVMDNPSDSIFRIKSVFKKKLKWFYTYITYSDTYSAINRFNVLPIDDFFTPEDFSFINRMPAEGKAITKADSLYLEMLNGKVHDHYAMQAIYAEHFNAMLQAMEKNEIDHRWVDSLMRYKGKMLSLFSKRIEKDDAFEEAFMVPLIDSLQISFPTEKVKKDYYGLHAAIKSRLNFMVEISSEGKFTHAITMPWKVITTNADSINGSTLYWQPPTIKFLLNDYTMYAASRKLNYWAVLIAGILILSSILAFWIIKRTGSRM